MDPKPIIYNLDYYENMLRMYSATSEHITKIRWNFVAETKAKYALDFGCGCGWFRAFRPGSIEVDSFDVASVPQTGILRKNYDLVCMWDVLEHIENYTHILAVLAQKTRYIALTVPIIPEGTKIEKWRHFKPYEHCSYFICSELDALFQSIGFFIVKKGQPECPPRKDIWSFLYEKIDIEA